MYYLELKTLETIIYWSLFYTQKIKYKFSYIKLLLVHNKIILSLIIFDNNINLIFVRRKQILLNKIISNNKYNGIKVIDAKT